MLSTVIGKKKKNHSLKKRRPNKQIIMSKSTIIIDKKLELITESFFCLKFDF